VTSGTSGTSEPFQPTNPYVSCARFREAVSARLDGEPLGLSAAALDGHLAACADCARWAESAAAVTRRARLDVRPVPDISDEIVSEIALPTRRVLRRRHVLRVLLGLVGLGQLALGVPAVAGHSIGMVMSQHSAHEAAAWSLALGVAFVGVASVPRRAAGLIPLLVTFLVVLGVLSARDLAAGHVGLDRLLTHVVALLGLLLLIALDRAERALPPGWAVHDQPGRADSGMRTVA
jgi:predicted anti-sigma-YlaC factor YlaD